MTISQHRESLPDSSRRPRRRTVRSLEVLSDRTVVASSGSVFTQEAVRPKSLGDENRQRKEDYL